jgi:hypothetical protein
VGEEIVRFYANAFAPVLKIVAKAVVLTSHYFSRILRTYKELTGHKATVWLREALVLILSALCIASCVVGWRARQPGGAPHE